MQNTIQKFRQSSIVFKKPGIQSENLKTLTSSNYPTVQYFLLKRFAFYLPMSTKGCVGFLFYLHLSYLRKLKKPWFLHTRFYTVINNSRSKQNKKKSHIPICRPYEVENVCKISVKYIKLYGSWSSSKFSIFRQKTWFLGNNRGLP